MSMEAGKILCHYLVDTLFFSLGNVVDAEGILAATKVDLVAIICFFD